MFKPGQLIKTTAKTAFFCDGDYNAYYTEANEILLVLECDNYDSCVQFEIFALTKNSKKVHRMVPFACMKDWFQTLNV